jgi:hypothetical protein
MRALSKSTSTTRNSHRIGRCNRCYSNSALDADITMRLLSRLTCENYRKLRVPRIHVGTIPTTFVPKNRVARLGTKPCQRRKAEWGRRKAMQLPVTVPPEFRTPHSALQVRPAALPQSAIRKPRSEITRDPRKPVLFGETCPLQGNTHFLNPKPVRFRELRECTPLAPREAFRLAERDGYFGRPHSSVVPQTLFVYDVGFP